MLQSPLLTLGFLSLHLGSSPTLTPILRWLLCLSLERSEWQSQPAYASRLLLSWLKSNQEYIVWKSPSFKISSWCFRVRPWNSCTALTQLNCESLYTFRLIITNNQFLPCLPDLSVMNDKVKGEKKDKKKKTEIEKWKENLLLSMFTTGQVISCRGSLFQEQEWLVSGNAATTLGWGTSRKELVLLSNPMHDLNSNAIRKPLRQVHKKDQSACWNGKHLYICSHATSPKRQHVPEVSYFWMRKLLEWNFLVSKIFIASKPTCALDVPEQYVSAVLRN